MDFTNQHKKLILCMLVVAVAITAIYMLGQLKENFDNSYFKNPSDPSFENRLESTTGMSKRTIMIIVGVLGILGGFLYFYMKRNRNDSSSLPELSETSSEL